MSQTTALVAKRSLASTIASYFSSPADRNGLTAVAVSLLTALVGALGITGPARVTAIVVAVVFAVYGVLRIVLPDNAAVKSDAALADTEEAAKALLLLVTTKQPAAFAAFVEGLAKVAADFSGPIPTAPVTPAPPPTTTA